MIATLVIFGGRHDAAAPGRRCWRGDRWWAARCSSPCSCRWCCAWRPDLRSRRSIRRRRTMSAPSCAQLRAGVRQPRRRADQRLRRHAARQPAADRRGRRPDERAAPVHAAGQPVRHVGLGRGTAGDVRRRGAPDRDAGPRAHACGGGSTPACGRSRSSSSRRRWRSSRSATSSPRRSCRPDGSAARTRSTCGASSPARRSGCLPSTLGRLYSSTYYALRDTRTPLRYAVVRVVLDIGARLSVRDPAAALARDLQLWGAAGLTASAGSAGWVEMLLLRRTLNARIGRRESAGELTSTALGLRPPRPPRWRGRSSWRVPRCIQRSRAVTVLGAYGVVFITVRSLRCGS